MNEYRTVQGDTWDVIAYRKLGSTDYTDQLISANLEHVGKLMFPAGVILCLPEIKEKPNANLPPWKRRRGDGMAEKVLAWRTSADITFDGTDITRDIKPYFLNLTYTDDTDDLADDLKIEVQDRDSVWLQKWLTEAVETAIRAIYPLTTVEEWFEYGGEPYHFRLNIDITSDSGDRVLERLNFYKSLRSHNDGVRYFLVPEKPWAVARGGYMGSREAEQAVIPVPPLKRPGGEVIILAGRKFVGSWSKDHAAIPVPPLWRAGGKTTVNADGGFTGSYSKDHATVQVPPLRRVGGKTTVNAGGGFTGSYSKDHAAVRVPSLQRADGSTAVSTGEALRGMYRKISTAVAVPELVRPKGTGSGAAATGLVGSVERVTVKVNAGKIRIPTGRAATGGTAGMFHSYQRIRVSVGSPAMTISGR